MGWAHGLEDKDSAEADVEVEDVEADVKPRAENRRGPRAERRRRRGESIMTNLKLKKKRREGRKEGWQKKDCQKEKRTVGKEKKVRKERRSREGGADAKKWQKEN